VLLILACGGEQAPSAPTPPPEPPAESSSAPPAATAPPPATAPPAQAERKYDVPEGNLRGDPVRGAEIYALYCATCHGATGKGDGPAGMALNPRAADHTNAAYMGSLSDAHIYQVINKGGMSVGKSPLMAPWGSIVNDQDIRALVAFIRQLSGT
jgi:mono/diheme cytochrome c family protein